MIMRIANYTNASAAEKKANPTAKGRLEILTVENEIQIGQKRHFATVFVSGKRDARAQAAAYCAKPWNF